jgi:defect-in-organelle-trafficking protein DotD
MSLPRFALVLPVAVLTLAGCSTVKGPPPVDNTYVTVGSTNAADPTDINARLAEAAQRTATAVENLASIEQARTPELYTPVVTNAPPELRLLLTVQWMGPWENLLSVMAERVGYQFRVLGKAPPTPIVVTVDAKQQPFVDVMRNVGLQAAGRADLVLDSQNKVVEVRYAPDTGR